jgi:hypothetical protein
VTASRWASFKGSRMWETSMAAFYATARVPRAGAPVGSGGAIRRNQRFDAAYGSDVGFLGK